MQQNTKLTSITCSPTNPLQFAVGGGTDSENKLLIIYQYSVVNQNINVLYNFDKIISGNQRINSIAYSEDARYLYKTGTNYVYMYDLLDNYKAYVVALPN